jgi:hypothetical protein
MVFDSLFASSISQQAPRIGGYEMTPTTFTQSEIDSAAWLELEPTWHWGYPQPRQDSFGYRDVTYRNQCVTCGAGGDQIAPFQLRGEPPWGTRNVFQLNWIFDEFFFKRPIALMLESEFGLQFREARGATSRVLPDVRYLT